MMDGDEPPGPVDALDLIDEAVIMFGLDMVVTAWNAAAERLYGFARHEVVGSRIQAAVQCSPNYPLATILATVRTTGEWRGKILRTRKDRSTVVVRARWSLRRTGDGATQDIVEASDDITELQRAEEALERVGNQYQNMFQASAASFWELDFTETVRIAAPHLRDGPAALRAYLMDQPEIVRAMIRATNIIDVNEQTLTMFGAGDKSVVMRLS